MMTETPHPAEDGAAMSLTPNEIRQVLDILANSAWDEAVVTVGDVTIAVARNGASLPTVQAPGSPSTPAAPAAAPSVAAPAPAPAPAAPVPHAPAVTVPTPSGGTLVEAPSVGVFWRAPEPGAPPFVEVGQRVEAGQDLCIVEVMKLMNRVPAPCSGVVTHIHVGNGEAVEYGTPLFTIDPE
jgi:acetyl-CoA carboxylase biotin carboxyl carrier protein